MNIDKIPLGLNPPCFNVIVERPQGDLPVKHEMDNASGAMCVDRFLNTSMTYPANYGFIPHTLAADGDPCDVLALDRSPVVPGAIISARPIGALVMTDEAGADDKIIAVPLDRLNPYYGWVKSPEDLPPTQRDQIAHFFQHYKDPEKGKWVAGLRWVGYEEALALVAQGIKGGRKTPPENVKPKVSTTAKAKEPGSTPKRAQDKIGLNKKSRPNNARVGSERPGRRFQAVWGKEHQRCRFSSKILPAYCRGVYNV